MKYCTGKIVEWLINHDAIESDDKELYEYALYSLWLLVTPLFLAIIVGLCFGRIKEGIVIVIPFMLLRKFSGGYHAKHLWICLTSSTLLLSLCVRLSFNLKYDWKLAIIISCCRNRIGDIAAQLPENKRLSNEEKEVV